MLWGLNFEEELLSAPSTSLGAGTRTPPSDYLAWLTTLYPHTYSRPLAEYHHEFWRWIWARRPDQSATGVFIWPRGFSKTTNCERAVVKLAAAGFKYILYVKGTQEGADDAVQNIGAILEAPEVAQHYPLLSDRQVNKYGSSKGWRRNRLRTAAGVIVDAAGLDTKIRGLLIEGQRPDVIFIDDVDDTSDTLDATEKKLRRLKADIIPAGAPNRLIVGVQNLINPHGIFTRLAGVNPDLQADFLLERTVSGPHPAILNLEYGLEEQPDGRRVYRITGGTSTWPEARPISVLESEMNEIGADTFIEEKQHEVMNFKGSLYEGFDFSTPAAPIPRPGFSGGHPRLGRSRRDRHQEQRQQRHPRRRKTARRSGDRPLQLGRAGQRGRHDAPRHPQSRRTARQHPGHRNQPGRRHLDHGV